MASVTVLDQTAITHVRRALELQTISACLVRMQQLSITINALATTGLSSMATETVVSAAVNVLPAYPTNQTPALVASRMPP